MRRRSLLFFMILSFSGCLASAQSFGQDRFPEFALTSDMNINEPVLEPEDQVDIEIKNPLMRDVIYLQDQINLLESLIERQAGIQKIADNYAKSGIPFKQPLPPLNACAKLPPNVLCLLTYPDLEQNREFIDNTQQQSAAVIIGTSQAARTPQRATERQEQTELTTGRAEDYNWSDIECKLENCSALIVSTYNPIKRYRVRSGDVIDGKMQILSVSPQGVITATNGFEQNLPPLTVSGNAQQNAEAQPALKNIVDRTLAKTPSREKRNIATEQFYGSDNTGQPATLGPTGLF